MATHCYVTYCDVAHLLWHHKRSRHYSKPACTLLKCPSKCSLSAILSKAKRRKLSLRQEKMTKLLVGLTHSVGAVPVDGSRKLLLKVLFQAMNEHRCLSQQALSTCVNKSHTSKIFLYFLTKLSYFWNCVYAGNAYHHQCLWRTIVIAIPQTVLWHTGSPLRACCRHLLLDILH